ncbi:MAG: hypothetical protein PUA49_03275 [Butyrivibrio sp.]|nr:hypothetical protein [Butyrivibrio sp.]
MGETVFVIVLGVIVLASGIWSWCLDNGISCEKKHEKGDKE